MLNKIRYIYIQDMYTNNILTYISPKHYIGIAEEQVDKKIHPYMRWFVRRIIKYN